MEQKKRSGSSEHMHMQPNINGGIKGGNPFDLDEMIGYGSSHSFSSSSSFGVDDSTFSNSEDYSSESQRSNPESVLNKTSMICASPSKASTLTAHLKAIYASPKRSPPIQVMARSAGYDPNRIPMSVFAARQTHNPEWNLLSNESLFSIQMGSYSFTTDSGTTISKYGDIHSNRLDDSVYDSCFMIDADKSNDSVSTVMGNVVEEKGESSGMILGKKEEIVEKRNRPPMGSENLDWSVLDGEEASRTEGFRNSASTPRQSDASGQSAASFGFPILAEAAPPPPPPPPPPPEQTTTTVPATKESSATPKAHGNQWFNCFSCCICCRR